MTYKAPSYASGSLTLDPLTVDDIPAFRELLDEAVELLEMTDVYTLTDEALRPELVGDPPHMEGVIARYKGELAGFATWSEGFHLVRGKRCMVFEYIYVRPPYRRHLISMALMGYMLVLARRRDYQTIEGMVHDWNSATAEMYRQMKAETVAQTAFRLWLKDIDWSLYKGVLGDADPTTSA
jgi:GNAT superfamily N-acetyltransferase